ncbi:hypothetical protein [Pseudomonas sp. PSE1(2024)]|uniref:hypothetical protein n=1 Tax=Pseudomonas sp. PSE1(2024) TaxID=3228746 RepID=UPI003D96F298
MNDSAILAVSVPYFTSMQTRGPSNIPADCGVTLIAIASDQNCVVDPFPGGRLGHTLRLFVNENQVAFATYKEPGDENTFTYFSILKDSLREGLNRVHCVVTSGSQNEGESGVLRAFFHRDGPVGDPDSQPEDGVNSNIYFDVEDAAKHGVGPELAKRGVLFYVYYPRLRAFDIISCFIGNHVFKYQVSEEVAARVRPDNPLEIRVPEAEFIAAGDGMIRCSSGPQDWIGNPALPEPYSREVSLFVNLRGAWLDAPVISPLTAAGDVDLGQLQRFPVISKTHVRSPQWVSGDIQRTVCTYTDAAGEDVVLMVDQVIDPVPGFPQEALSNSYISGAKDQRVSIYCKQLRRDVEVARSNVTEVGVFGQFDFFEGFENLSELKIYKVGEFFLSDIFKVTLVGSPQDICHLHLFSAQRSEHVTGMQLYAYAGDAKAYVTYELEFRSGTAKGVDFWMCLGNITDYDQHMNIYFIGVGGEVLHTIRYKAELSDLNKEINFDSGDLGGIRTIRVQTTGQFVFDSFIRR